MNRLSVEVVSWELPNLKTEPIDCEVLLRNLLVLSKLIEDEQTELPQVLKCCLCQVYGHFAKV